MSHLNPGLISAYNSLTDKHLAGYFSNTRIRRHLQRAGLITRSGRIVPDKEYRHKVIQRAHQRHVRECLAQAIFHKVLEMERLHQVEIKRKLEEFARRERVHKIKVERSKRYEEELVRILSPRPPTGARNFRKQHSGADGEHSESSESPSSSRPNTAPGKMQRPVRLKPIHSNRRSSPYRLLESGNLQPLNCTMDKESRRRLTAVEPSHGVSPYCLPVINNFVTPVPPTTKRKERGAKVTGSSTVRGRRLRSTTASSAADVSEDPPMLRSSVHQSKVTVNMVYFGKSVHLSHDLTDMKDDVKVFQQHCGGENLCVFKGKLREGEIFQFISRRHRGFPFSLTFFLNGLQVERLSSCCEFKHRRGSRLGGRHGHFGFSGVEGASPCYKCIIAIGLDKKPTPPPRRVKETRGSEESETSPKETPEMERDGRRDDVASHSECETSLPQEMETQVEEERAHEEDKVRDDYEEDFEADDEGPAEDARAQEKNSPSPASEAEKLDKQKDGTESEEDMKSRSGSSSSGSDEEESDDEAPRATEEEEKAVQPEEVKQEENVSLSVETDESKPEAAAAPEGESTAAKDSDLQDSAGDSTEIEISDTSVPSGKEKKSSDEALGHKDAEKKIEENKQEEEQERSKSVQEKLAEAILKESQCSSEPELSDTSTEESMDEGPKQLNNEIVTEKLLTAAENPEPLVEETKWDESLIGEHEAVREEEESFETKQQKDESELGPQENSDSTKDEKVDEIEEETTTGDDPLENAGETPDPVDEENVAHNDKTADHLEEEAAEKLNNAEAVETNEGMEEKAAVDADVQHDETGQRAKSREEDESSVSEPNERSDETALPDTAEVEATTASETMEIKAESSEEREAVSCEDAPVSDAGGTQQAGSNDRTAASETEVRAEISNDVGDGEKTADRNEECTNHEENVQGEEVTMSDAAGVDASEKNTKDEESVDASTKDEESKDDVKEEGEETPARKQDSQLEECELGEKSIEKSVERVDKVGEIKSEDEGKDGEKDTNTDQIAKEEKNGNFINGGQGADKADVRVEKEENIEVGGENIMTEAKDDEEVKKSIREEDENMTDEKVEAPGKTEEDEKSDSHENKDEKVESEAKEAGKNDVAQEKSDTNNAVEEKDDEKLEKDENESRTEQKEITVYETKENCEVEREATDETVVGGDITESAEDVEKDIEANEETLDNTTEEEKDKLEAEIGSDRSEEGGIDAENGEISTAAETKSHENEEEDQLAGKDELKVAEKDEEEGEPEESPENHGTDVKESAVESGDGVENQDEQPSGGDVRGKDAQETDGGMETQKESTREDSQLETVGTEMTRKFDSSEGGETGKKSDIHGENEDSDLIENNNIQSDITEVSVASSRDQESQHLNQENKESIKNFEFEMEKNALAEENVVGVDRSAADGENRADTEEASKASEEGASVLLKPQAQPEEIDEARPSIIMVKGPPEALAVADNKDLVSNWVNMHQSSKFFETYVEPLEDLQESSDAREETSSPVRPEIPVMTSEDKEEASKVKAECETRDETKVEDLESDLVSVHAGEKPCDNISVEDTHQIEVKAEVEETLPEAQIEQGDTESANIQDGSKRSLEEDKTKDGPAHEINEENVPSKTEVESTSGTQYALASGKPGSVAEVQVDKKTTSIGANLIETQNMKDILPFSEAEERQSSKSPDRANDTDETPERTGEEQSREATEVTEMTASKSDDESQEESHSGEVQQKVSEGSVDRRELIQDIKNTLSKDRLSTFSVDETLFGRSSLSLLTTARTESGH